MANLCFPKIIKVFSYGLSDILVLSFRFQSIIHFKLVFDMIMVMVPLVCLSVYQYYVAFMSVAIHLALLF